MTHTLAKIYGKPSDYKICSECGCVNWYENESCVNQCTSSILEENDNGVVAYIEDDYRYYRKEGYSENEIDNILKDV